MTQLFPSPRDVINALPTQRAFPDSYFIWDLETSGFHRQYDVVVEAGWGIVHNRQLVDYGGVILDWTRHGGWSWQHWLRQRLEKVAREMSSQGRTYHFTYDRLAAEGVDPHQGMYDFVQLLWQFIRNAGFLVGHGIYYFDSTMVDGHTNRFMGGYELPWDMATMLDTALIEKAAETNSMPWVGDTLHDWYKRVQGIRSKGTRWNLGGHCTEKYNLAERFHLDMNQTHRAGFDCVLEYGLVETYRQIAFTHEQEENESEEETPAA